MLDGTSSGDSRKKGADSSNYFWKKIKWQMRGITFIATSTTTNTLRKNCVNLII